MSCNKNCKCGKTCKCRQQQDALAAAIVERPSPNFGDRNGASVSHLVLHYTAMQTAESAVEWLCNPKSGVSSHYVVGRDGTVYRLVAEDKRAWHAGDSFWSGDRDINTTSVGIEIDNDGESDYPKVQMDAVTALCRDIIRRHGISAHNVVGHSDVAPARKQDPGDHFDWEGLAAAGIGIYPSPTQQDYDKSKAWTDKQVRDALTQVGYRTDATLKIVVTAFQRRFQQDVFKDSAKIGVADKETKARLACLVRRKLTMTRKRCATCGGSHPA